MHPFRPVPRTPSERHPATRSLFPRAAAALAATLAGLLALAFPPSNADGAQDAAPSHAPRLILLSIDGMRPDFYTKPEYRKAAPTLARLSDEGERAPRGLRPIFPSITYPDHTSMVTGAYPDEHGVWSNQIYSEKTGLSEDWYWYAKQIRVPTLWDKAEQAGKKVALIRWPASTDAEVDWDLPEIFVPSGFKTDEDWALIRQHIHPESLRDVLEKGENGRKFLVPTTLAELDEVSTQAAEYLLDHEGPDLILLHLVNVDHIQHGFGTDAPEVTQAIAGVDRLLARIVRRLDPARTTLIVTADHGFATYTKTIHLPSLIAEAGLEGKILAQVDGPQAAIYPEPGSSTAGKPPKKSEDAGACAALVKTLLKHSRTPLMQAIDRVRLKKLHAYPEAICVLEARMGVAISGKPAQAGDPVVEALTHPRGTHGYLPSRPEMQAGFFIWGKGSRKGLLPQGSEHPQMPDIAPTAASILGIPFDTPSGREIRF